MSKADSQHIRATLDEIIAHQIHDQTPPETRQTWDRLIALGISEDRTRELLATVLLQEMEQMAAAEEVFQHDRYAAALHRLPEVEKDRSPAAPASAP